jgi:dGTPase
MSSQKFSSVAANESHPLWPDLIKRSGPLYSRSDDPRSEFVRDYNRILHCTAYRRLKHKTQVFFAVENDHICTRIEHVNHVAAISRTIARELGLNIELTDAIGLGHDLGHAPFGHEGESILDQIALKVGLDHFWHEKNSLWFVDNLETLLSPGGTQDNLSLTYAVRDGIVCHCGEIDQNNLFPRNTILDLHNISRKGEYQPVTWEGCVVKIADKIAFLGRDIEDAFALKLLTPGEFALECKKIAPELESLLKRLVKISPENISNTAVIHELILNLTALSNPAAGLQFSPDCLALINELRKVSNNLIYNHPRLNCFKKLAHLVLNSIFEELFSLQNQGLTAENLEKRKVFAPGLYNSFEDWLIKYSDFDPVEKESRQYSNKTVYTLDKSSDYARAVIDFISGMTDKFAMSVFEELTRFN